MVDWDVWSPLMISTPFCTGTGFMKCVLMTLDAALRSVGLSLGVVEAAILVTDIDEVLVARMAWEGAIFANWENIEVLRSRISGTASMMKSAEERSSILVVGSRRERASEASDCEILDLETSFSSSLSVRQERYQYLVNQEKDCIGLPANFNPLSREACELSTRVTGTCAFCAATSAIPSPWHQLNQSPCSLRFCSSGGEHPPSALLPPRLLF